MPLILLKKKNFVFYDHLHGNGGYYAKWKKLGVEIKYHILL
jgi:hypothetical protein